MGIWFKTQIDTDGGSRVESPTDRICPNRPCFLRSLVCPGVQLVLCKKINFIPKTLVLVSKVSGLV